MIRNAAFCRDAATVRKIYPRFSALSTALSEALGALEARDRLRLGYYYLENLTLREIARLLNEPSIID